MRSLIAPDTLLALVADGLTVREISETLGISKKTARSRLSGLGVKAADDTNHGTPPEVLQALVDEGLTLHDIARRLGRDPAGISQRLRKLGIRLGEANREAGRQKKVAAGRSQVERLVKANAARARSRAAGMSSIVKERPQLPAGTVRDMEAQIAAMVAAGAVTRCPPAFVAPTKQRGPVPGAAPVLRSHAQANEEREAQKRRTWVSKHYRGASA